MDLVDWSEERFDEIVTDFARFAAVGLGVVTRAASPIAALHGDNVVRH